MSYWHLALNRNKKGLTLNLKTEEGREILRRLCAKADVFLEGFRPGFLESLGLGFADLQKVNPRLIYCAITGFGAEGKYKHLASARPEYFRLVWLSIAKMIQAE
jgi:crotonobetainyl-CoA:carnitine CoA-transferase CaiB-like acyl-CoA transferase